MTALTIRFVHPGTRMMQMRSRIGGWDVHTHLIPQGLVKSAKSGAYQMSLRPGQICICGHGVPLHPICEAEKLVDHVQKQGLDGAIVSVPPPLFRPDLSAEDRRAYADFVNSALLSACRAHPPILRPLAYLPAEDPKIAAQITETLDSKWAGVVIGTELGGRTYADQDYNALWRALEDRDLPIFIHPGASPDRRLDPFYLSNLLGNPVETTIAAAHLIFGGVLHDFPGLKFILAHGGGAVAALAGRWQRGLTTKRPDLPDMPSPPIEVVRRFFIDSIVHSAAYEKLLIEVIGKNQILFGSDWPFPMGADAASSGFKEDMVKRIRNDNVVRIFGRRLIWTDVDEL